MGFLDETGLSSFFTKLKTTYFNHMVSDTTFQTVLTNYLQNNGTTTANGYALDAKYGKTLADEISSLNSRLEIKHATYTGTTNTGGIIMGGLSDFGMSDGTRCIGTFLRRDSYGAFRKADFGAYGNAGIYVACSEGNGATALAPINSGTVTIDFYYI